MILTECVCVCCECRWENGSRTWEPLAGAGGYASSVSVFSRTITGPPRLYTEPVSAPRRTFPVPAGKTSTTSTAARTSAAAGAAHKNPAASSVAAEIVDADLEDCKGCSSNDYTWSEVDALDREFDEFEAARRERMGGKPDEAPDWNDRNKKGRRGGRGGKG